MQVEMWSLDQIKPYEKNPRINDDAVAAVAKSLETYGFRQAVVVDAEGVIIVGHTRWKAAELLGLEKVPVHIARDLEPEAVRAYRIADNKTAELSEWDFDLLPIELQELGNVGYDLGVLGFNQEELAQLPAQAVSLSSQTRDCSRTASKQRDLCPKDTLKLIPFSLCVTGFFSEFHDLKKIGIILERPFNVLQPTTFGGPTRRLSFQICDFLFELRKSFFNASHTLSLTKTGWLFHCHCTYLRLNGERSLKCQ